MQYQPAHIAPAGTRNTRHNAAHSKEKQMKRTLTTLTRDAILEAEPLGVNEACHFLFMVCQWIESDIAARQDDMRRAESNYHAAIQLMNTAQEAVNAARREYGALYTMQVGLGSPQQSAWIDAPARPTSAALEAAQRAVTAAEAEVARLGKETTAMSEKRYPIMNQVDELKALRVFCERRIPLLAGLLKQHSEPEPTIPQAPGVPQYPAA